MMTFTVVDSTGYEPRPTALPEPGETRVVSPFCKHKARGKTVTANHGWHRHPSGRLSHRRQRRAPDLSRHPRRMVVAARVR